MSVRRHRERDGRERETETETERHRQTDRQTDSTIIISLLTQNRVFEVWVFFGLLA